MKPREKTEAEIAEQQVKDGIRLLEDIAVRCRALDKLQAKRVHEDPARSRSTRRGGSFACEPCWTLR